MADNPTGASKSDQRLAEMPDLFRSRDIEAVGMERASLQLLLDRGAVERVARGVYRKIDAPLSELETVAAVAARIPDGIVCLLSALRIHEIGTQSPREVWMAIDSKARKPSIADLPVRIVRFSGAMLTYGVTTSDVLGQKVRITNAARTVVDCFRYRNKLGMDVALEALREVLREKRASVSEIDRAAEVCRMRTVMRPYLESLLG